MRERNEEDEEEKGRAEGKEMEEGRKQQSGLYLIT